MKRVIALAVAALLSCGVAYAQMGSFFPGPGTPHSTGGSFSLTAGTNVGSGVTGAGPLTYAGVSWGSGCNAVLFQIFWYNTVTTDVVSSVGVSGNSGATQVAGVASHTVSNGGQSIDAWQLNSPVGTSATITVAFSGNVTYNSNVTAYCLISGTTAATSASSTPGIACNNVVPITGVVVTPTGGAAAVMSSTVSGSILSWTNATLDGSYVGGSTQDSWAHTTAAGSVTVSATPTAGDNCTLGWVAYGP